jgi:hypothetical protein
MSFLAGRRKRQVVTAAVVAGSCAVFAGEWAAAPRVEASPYVERQLASARGAWFLGETFEGLPLRTVSPFLYSDCDPGHPTQAPPMPCTWLKVARGRVTGADPKQVARARRALRRVP